MTMHPKLKVLVAYHRRSLVVSDDEIGRAHV